MFWDCWTSVITFFMTSSGIAFCCAGDRSSKLILLRAWASVSLSILAIFSGVRPDRLLSCAGFITRGLPLKRPDLSNMYLAAVSLVLGGALSLVTISIITL